MRAVLAVVAACSIVVLAGCASSSENVQRGRRRSTVPVEFRHACGHAHSRVKVRHVPVLVRHADCDLTGVLITYRNYGGAYVSDNPGTVGMSSGLTISVARGTRDVSISAPKFGPGNA